MLFHPLEIGCYFWVGICCAQIKVRMLSLRCSCTDWGAYVKIEVSMLRLRCTAATPPKVTAFFGGIWLNFELQWLQGHQQLSRKSEENKSFKPNQIAPSIYIMIELCYFSLDQWEIKIHLLWGKCFNIPHWPRSHLTNGRLQHIEGLSKSSSLWPSFSPNQM